MAVAQDNCRPIARIVCHSMPARGCENARTLYYELARTVKRKGESDLRHGGMEKANRILCAFLSLW